MCSTPFIVKYQPIIHVNLNLEDCCLMGKSHLFPLSMNCFIMSSVKVRIKYPLKTSCVRAYFYCRKWDHKDAHLKSALPLLSFKDTVSKSCCLWFLATFHLHWSFTMSQLCFKPHSHYTRKQVEQLYPNMLTPRDTQSVRMALLFIPSLVCFFFPFFC